MLHDFRKRMLMGKNLKSLEKAWIPLIQLSTPQSLGRMRRSGGSEENFDRTRCQMACRTLSWILISDHQSVIFFYLDRSHEICFLNLVTHEHCKSALKYFPGILPPNPRMTQAGERKAKDSLLGLLGGVEWIEFSGDLKNPPQLTKGSFYAPSHSPILSSLHNTHFLYLQHPESLHCCRRIWTLENPGICSQKKKKKTTHIKPSSTY